MPSNFALLVFARAPGGERLVLVEAAEGIRRCRDGGFQAMAPNRAVVLVDTLCRSNMVAVRSFLAHVRLARFDLSEMRDCTVLDVIRQRVRTGDLLVLREASGNYTGRGDETRNLRRLVRSIDSKGRGRLALSGRRYRLVVDVDLDGLPERDRYETVGHDEAVRVLEVVAAEAGSEADFRSLMTQARAKLTRDWRPPFQPDGLVLLRRIVTQQASKAEIQPLTPSQMKRLITKTEWIEIVVEDQDGEPYSGRYRIRLPDATSREDTLDEAGFYGNYDLEAGNCKFELLDRTQPKPAAGAGDEESRSLPITIGDDIRLPDDACFVLAGGGDSRSITLADKFDAAVGVYTFALEPLRSGVLYSGSVTFGATSTTMFRDDDLYTRAGASVEQPLDFDLGELEHQLQAGDPAALEADPPMRDQTHADDQQASQVPENETCVLVPDTFGPHVETGEDN